MVLLHLHKGRAVAVTGLVTSLATVAALVSGPATSASAAPEAAACYPFTEPELDRGVPTAEDVLGMPLGTRDVTVEESDRYLRAVSEASPKVVDGVLGESWEGRPLRYAVVGRTDWVDADGLARVARDVNRLRDPRTPAALAEQLLKRTPAVLWVTGNVHGGEESGTDASLRVLYELAARTDCTAAEILDHAIVVVLPSQNPDGREADTRRNRYGFDLNRDWFARTQPETDGKLEMLRRLPPQMYVDAHEMGRRGFFFPPNADPVYHDIGETPLDWIYNLLGPAMQDAFGRFGYDYFNGSAYDLFYMGYGDTVPATGFNAAGMTFEKYSGDPTATRMRQQYTAIWASLMAAGSRDSLLREWRDEHLEAARQGAAGELEPNQLYWEGAAIENPVPDEKVRHYFIRTDDPAKAEETAILVRRLQRMDVDVFRLVRPLQVPDFKAYGRQARDAVLPVGTLWVPMAQGQKHWIQAMLHEDTYVPFPYFYDVTAWSGPLLANIAGGRSGAVLDPEAVRVHEVAEPEPASIEGAPDVAVWQVSSSAVESAGWLRWYLDHRLALPHQDVTGTDIAGGALDDVDVLVVPSGSDAAALSALGDSGVQRLTDWVADGGTLVTLRDSSRLANRLGLTSATYEDPTSDIPGSLIRVEVDPDSPLAKGVGETAYAMYEYDYVWSTPDPDAAVASYPEAGDPDWFISGFAENEEQLHGTAAVVDEAYGDGRVVLFGFDPNYRAFTDGTAKMLRNAILEPATGVLADGVAPGSRAVEPATGPSATDRLVLTVRSAAADDVVAMVRSYGATADVVRARGRVSFRVDLGGLRSDEHPFAERLAEDVAGLGNRVVAIRLP